MSDDTRARRKINLTSKLTSNGRKVDNGWVDTDCLNVRFFPYKLEDNIFRVVQLFMFGDPLKALSLLIQQD